MLKLIFLISLLIPHVLSANNEPVKPPQDYLKKKVVSWLFQNLHFNDPSYYSREKIVYTDQELNEKLIEVFELIKPLNAKQSYLAYLTLAKSNLKNHDELTKRLEHLIKKSTMSQSKKDFIYNTLKQETESKLPEVNIHKNNDQFNIFKAFKEVRKLIEKIPGNSYFENLSKKALIKIENLLIGKVDNDDCYKNKPSCQYGSNKGIVRYFAKRVSEDHELALANLKIGILVSNLNQSIPIPHANYETNSSIDLWNQITELVGDKKLALLALTVFGHDVCCNTLQNKLDHSGLTKILNTFRTSGYGGDYNPKSWLYIPGVIAGKKVSKNIIHNLKKYKTLYEKFNKKDKEVFLRGGYHHFYGGILTATVLLEDNLAQYSSLDIATLISQSLGFFYKYTQTPRYISKDARKLWSSIKDTQDIKKIKIPIDWTQEKFNKAKSELLYHLAIIKYTEAQHRLGSKFAQEVFSQ